MIILGSLGITFVIKNMAILISTDGMTEVVEHRNWWRLAIGQKLTSQHEGGTCVSQHFTYILCRKSWEF